MVVIENFTFAQHPAMSHVAPLPRFVLTLIDKE